MRLRPLDHDLTVEMRSPRVSYEPLYILFKTHMLVMRSSGPQAHPIDAP